MKSFHVNIRPEAPAGVGRPHSSCLSFGAGGFGPAGMRFLTAKNTVGKTERGKKKKKKRKRKMARSNVSANSSLRSSAIPTSSAGKFFFVFVFFLIFHFLPFPNKIFTNFFSKIRNIHLKYLLN